MTYSISQDRVSLQSLKVADFASEETLCFSAVVLLDGKPIANASNDGHGGCTFLRSVKGAEVCLAEAEAYAKSLPSLVTDYEDPKDRTRKLSISMDLETLVDILASDMHAERKIRAAFNRDIVSKVLYIKDERLLYLKGVRLKAIKDPDAFFALFRPKHGADTVILNQLSRDEAFLLWKRHAVKESGTR